MRRHYTITRTTGQTPPDRIRGFISLAEHEATEGKIVVSEHDGYRLRRIWHEGQWWHSAVDIVAGLTESADGRKYWNKLKQRLIEEGGARSVTNCHQLKLPSADGKSYKTAYRRVKNIVYRVMPDDSLFPHEILKYDTWVMREVLHNCIAHQDYTMQGRINVIEREDTLTFTNLGSFIPQSIGKVLESDFTPDRFRNRFLSDAMLQINMIDTIGSGIRRMFRKQRERGFPLPDYDLHIPNKVTAVIYAKVLDENYTRALLSEPGLDIFDVMALDKVQKRRNPTELELKSLRRKSLVEGRRPNLYISAKVARVTGRQVEHVLDSGVGDNHYKTLVLRLIDEFHTATPEQINRLLLPKLPAVLNEQQKKDKVRNLIQAMRKDGSIRNIGKSGKGAVWALPV